MKNTETTAHEIPRGWGTVRDATQRFPISHGALYVWINNGWIDSRIVPVRGQRGTGVRLIDLESVERFIRNCPTKSSMRVTRRKRMAGRASAAAKLARAAAKNGRGKK
jgi:hypothetical protein